jgi:hypothetical protein
MAILFAMQYVGSKGNGLAAICIGNGSIVGFDGTDGRYRGSYIEDAGRIRGRVKMSYPGEWPLVTGAVLQPGDVVELAFDWSLEFADGAPQQLFVNGQPVTIIARKIGEI